jgi:hypothetical protein
MQFLPNSTTHYILCLSCIYAIVYGIMVFRLFLFVCSLSSSVCLSSSLVYEPCFTATFCRWEKQEFIFFYYFFSSSLFLFCRSSCDDESNHGLCRNRNKRGNEWCWGWMKSNRRMNEWIKSLSLSRVKNQDFYRGYSEFETKMIWT